VRARAVAAGPDHLHEQAVGRGHQGTRTGYELTARDDRRLDVQAVRRVDGPTGGVENALGDHVTGTVPAFLARLEHEHDVPGEIRAPRREQLCRADEPRGVQVVSARVHCTVVVRRERLARVLGDRQRIHVAAQQYDRAWFATTQHCCDR